MTSQSENQPAFAFPANDEHVTIVGRNGCGKTQLGCFLVGRKNLKKERVVALDFKGDDLLNSLKYAKSVDGEKVPRKPGLYLRHFNRASPDQINDFLWRIWEEEETTVYIDEGYFVPQGETDAYKGLLTTGRSKHIPVITLSQRPVRISRFALSEVSHVVVFDLNDRRDWRTLDEVLPDGFTEWKPEQFPGPKLPRYYARWYNVKTDGRYVIEPVPSADEIRELIDDQLEPDRRWF
jgi:hypothetical protein